MAKVSKGAPFYKEARFTHEGVEYAVMVKVDQKVLQEATETLWMGRPMNCRLYNLSQCRQGKDQT